MSRHFTADIKGRGLPSRVIIPTKGPCGLSTHRRLLRVVGEGRRDGSTLHGSEVVRVTQASGIPPWDVFRNLWQGCHLIRRTEEGGYVLIRDLRALTMAELLNMVPWPSEQQLRIHANGKESWETILKERCDRAREGLRAPLDFPLEALFDNRLDQGPDVKEEEKGDNP